MLVNHTIDMFFEVLVPFIHFIKRFLQFFGFLLVLSMKFYLTIQTFCMLLAFGPSFTAATIISFGR